MKNFCFFFDSVAEKDNAVSSFYRIKIGQELRDMGQSRIWSSNVASVAMVCFICMNSNSPPICFNILLCSDTERGRMALQT